MDTIQREKNHIQKREKATHAALSLFSLTAFLVSIIILPYSLARSPVAFIHAIFSIWWFPLLFGFLLFFFIVGLGIIQLAPFMQKTQRRKQHWLNEYGLQIQAVVSKYPEENALVINRSIRGRGASFARYLNWQDSETAQRYSYCVSTRFYRALRNLPEGTLYPVQLDPDDLSFFDVPGK